MQPICGQDSHSLFTGITQEMVYTAGNSIQVCLIKLCGTLVKGTIDYSAGDGLF